jgi:hypothetical protein
MMFGSGDPTRFDVAATALLCGLAMLLLVGCVVGPRWASPAATFTRWLAVALAAAIVTGVLTVTPTMSGTVGAGRMITLWPSAAAVAIFFLIWSWRLGHL